MKGIDLSKLDFVVMSHRHGDHMGGLSYVLKVNPAVKIYAPKEGWVYGADCPVRSIERMPPCLLSSVTTMALRRTSCDSGRLGPGNFQLVDRNTEIAPDIHLIALVSDKPGTLELRELSLAISTPEGIVIVVGCSHPGIDKIVAAASTINPRVHLIAGGSSRDGGRLGHDRIVTALHDQFKVDYIAPGHCTGALHSPHSERLSVIDISMPALVPPCL